MSAQPRLLGQPAVLWRGAFGGLAYRSAGSTRIADIHRYIHAVENDLAAIAETQETTPLEFACETAVLNLRRITGIDRAEYRATTGYDAMDLFAGVIADGVDRGLLVADDAGVRLTRQALPIADSVLCDFSTIDD